MTEEKRIAVFSDSHNSIFSIRRALPIINLCDVAIFLGDGISDVLSLRSEIKPPVIMVRGNNDFQSGYDNEKIEEIFGEKFFITHGHYYSVKSGFETVMEKARENNCRFCLFGHTHEPICSNEGDLFLINPGSIGRGYGCGNSFAIIEKNKDSFFAKIVSN